MHDHQLLWTPSEEFRRQSPMFSFMQECNRRFGLSMSDFSGLHAWSVADRENFRTAVWDFCGVKDTLERALSCRNLQ